MARGFLIAPLAAPLAYSALVAAESPGEGAFLVFLVLFVAGSLFAYAATAALLLPSLFVLSRFVRLTILNSSLVGAALGLVAYVLLAFIIWQVSGPASRPPTDAWIWSLARGMTDPKVLAFPFGGLVTAALFHLIIHGVHHSEV